MLCNMLVCLAVWLSVAARSVEGKVIAIAFPISAFVALGFEHCVANFYLLAIGMLSGAKITALDFASNIAFVTVGNTLGGILLAVLLYLIYLGKDQVQRSFSRPALLPYSLDLPAPVPPTVAESAQAPTSESTIATPAEEPVRAAEVRLRLKSEHGPATPPEKDPVVTKLVFTGTRRGGGRK
ncbi:MAG: formate/nitrite transporter family protein [Hyphomicrobiaceae bacterium]